MAISMAAKRVRSLAGTMIRGLAARGSDCIKIETVRYLVRQGCTLQEPVPVKVTRKRVRTSPGKAGVLG